MHPRGYEANFLDIALQQSCVSVRGILSPNGAEEVGDTEGRKGPVIEAVAALGVVCDVVPSEEHAVTQPEEADDGPPQPPQGGAGLALSQDFFFLPLRFFSSSRYSSGCPWLIFQKRFQKPEARQEVRFLTLTSVFHFFISLQIWLPK